MEYIIISHGNCNINVEPMKISLNTKKIDEWDLNKIKSYQITPDSISSIVVGPRTVLEFFYGPSFTGQSHKVINDTQDKVKVYTFFDCPKKNTQWSVSLNSFKIWSFDYYDSIFGIRYCDSDKNCDDNELCMCDNGKVNPLWCPTSKRRCMNEKYLYDYSEIPINNEDIIKTNCLTKQLNNENISFEELKKRFRPCMENKLKNIENFSDTKICPSVFKLYIYILLIIFVTMLIVFIIKNVCSY
jgi:hypothetical protein